MSRKLKIGGACLNQTPMDWEGNTKRIEEAIQKARNEKVDILCLPELCITGYGCEDWFLSDWIPETALSLLDQIITFTKDILVIVGLPIRWEEKTYNAIAVLRDQELVGFYAKHNLANEGVHYEPRWFSSWPYHKVVEFPYNNKTVPLGAIHIEYKDVKVGFEICEDAWQADRPACNLKDDGIELILNPSASHFAFDKEKIREDIVVNSSGEFDCTYLYTNLLGNEAGRMIYDGDILIAQKGKLIGHNRRFSFKEVNTLFLTVDFDTSEHEKDIRKDPVDAFEEFANALPLALFDYCRKSHSNGFVLSLSGGADSSTIAIMVARMVELGCEELGQKAFLKKIGLEGNFERQSEIVGALLTVAYQGTKNSSSETESSARVLAESIGATYLKWEIDEQVDSYTKKIENALGYDLNWDDHDLTLQNIQARARSPIIWMIANLNRALLLSTPNRSEGDVGYTTMDGDSSGSISPIAAVPKVFLLDWLKYAETELGHLGLKEVNRLNPTAELRPLEKVQTDEDDLMPYSVMAQIERLAIKEKKSPRFVFQNMVDSYDPEELKDWIKKFFQLWSRNQWKRERLAPAFHLDDFNVDPRTWCRFPILSAGFKSELENIDL